MAIENALIEIVETIKFNVKSEDVRYEIYTRVLDAFHAEDTDLEEALGIDKAFDSIWEERFGDVEPDLDDDDYFDEEFED